MLEIATIKIYVQNCSIKKYVFTFTISKNAFSKLLPQKYIFKSAFLKNTLFFKKLKIVTSKNTLSNFLPQEKYSKNTFTKFLPQEILF